MASSSPLLTLEKMLNGKTTLKTQRVTHNNIICIGTEVLNEINQQIIDDKKNAVREAVAIAEENALAKRKEALRVLSEKMNEEREQALKEAQIRAEKQIAEIKYRCEVAEKKRARAAFEQYKVEKNITLQKQAEKLGQEKQEALQDLALRLTKELQSKAALEREKAIAEALSIARKNAEKRKQEAIECTKKKCEEQAIVEAVRVLKLHSEQMDKLNQRINYLQVMLDTERSEKKTLQGNFLDMKDDYKRFQNYTKGFHSDYLLK